MWLVLCPDYDSPARWAFEGLRARGLAPLEFVSAEALTRSRRWEHRVGADGADVQFELPDGRVLRGRDVRGVLNRLTHVPVGHLRATRDHDYMTQEFTAFFMSWLYALPGPILNRPTPQGLGGRWRHSSEWVLLASSAGLPTPPYRLSSQDGHDEMTAGERSLLPAGTKTRQVVVVAGQTFAPFAVPDEISAGCVRLAAAAETPLLGVDFSAGGEWTFAGATPLPDLRAGGAPLLDALARALRAEAGKEAAQ
jgi:hypothetical protein